MKTLHLTLKKKWFDMILSGEKKEEYRAIKPYWWSRLVHRGQIYEMDSYDELGKVLLPEREWRMYNSNHFDTVTFRNGYAKNSPTVVVECKGIEIDTGEIDWGATPREKYFVIKLGEILKTENV